MDEKTYQKELEIAPPLKALDAFKKRSILDRWGLTAEELTEIVDANGSMRGLMLGYVAEFTLKKTLLQDKRLTNLTKDDDHDRKNKGDLKFTYRQRQFKMEVKSLQTNSIRETAAGRFQANFQCDASDRRKVHFDDGSSVETTCLRVGEFDILAVNLFSLTNEWKFAFAANAELPRSAFGKYTEYQQQRLLKSIMPITWPLQRPYCEDFSIVLDRIIDRA